MDVAVVDPIQWEEDGAWSGSEMGPPAKMARVNPGGAEEAHPREDAAGVWQCAGVHSRRRGEDSAGAQGAGGGGAQG
eukprot:2423631-Pyramimonas_sp.AAC.1